MARSYDEIILAHYAGEAEAHGAAATSTMADVRTRELETAFVAAFVERYVPGRATVGDVGCGNGHTLAQVRTLRPEARLIGIEFTRQLREIAEQRFADDAGVEIRAGDVRYPLGDSAAFDALICQRVLINLLDPEDQRTGLRNLAAALKPGGHLVLIEAFESGLAALNAARREFALEPLPPAHHNLYLADAVCDDVAALRPVSDSALPANFLSTHYFVSRVLHPLLLGDRPFARNSHFVRFFSEALRPAVGDYAPVRGLVFVKA